LILADDIATKCREFHGDFLLGHRVARIALGNIDPRGVWLAVIGGDSHTARLEFGKERFELFVRHHFHFVHDRDERLIQHAFFAEL